MGELWSLALEPNDSGTTLKVSGEIDLDTAPRLRECLAGIPGDVVVDLTDVGFVDSQAIGVLLAEHKSRVAAGHELVVRGASPMALRTFAISGVDQVLNLDGDAPAAGP